MRSLEVIKGFKKPIILYFYRLNKILVCGDALIDAGERVAALAGPFTDAETLTVTRDLLNILGSEDYYTEEYCSVNTDLRSHYLMNMPLTGIEYADCEGIQIRN